MLSAFNLLMRYRDNVIESNQMSLMKLAAVS
jgi:hypothetical protein